MAVVLTVEDAGVCVDDPVFRVEHGVIHSNLRGEQVDHRADAGGVLRFRRVPRHLLELLGRFAARRLLPDRSRGFRGVLASDQRVAVAPWSVLSPQWRS